jgi:hypothetical protein
MNKCDCYFDSQYAYIVKELNDEISEENKITIVEYLDNEKLQIKIKKNKQYLVCSNGNELIKYESNIKRSHFKHKNDPNSDGMSEWHKKWQSNFEITEKPIGNRFADACVDNVVLEFQHSRIPKNLIDERKLNYDNNNKELLWIIDCKDSVNIDELENNRYMITFNNSELWKYENFISHNTIYLDVDDKIFRINPNKVKSHMYDVNEYKTKEEFIQSIKNKVNIWCDDELSQCVLYHNQRGAGCGKTYESIQLLDKSEIFKHKDTFIFLTKMHSAKEVIYNELKEQYERGDLSNLKLLEEGNDMVGKQYLIKYKNNKNNKNCTLIIGTIDSFMYAIGNKNVRDRNYFSGIVKSIKDGFVDTGRDGSIKYASEKPKLNKNCLIIIDEAQDLEPKYIQAISNIMRNTYIDTYVIGDKLQSIWGEHNIHTFLETNDLPTININRNMGINHVMRFHNQQFMDFVNKIIDFKKYNLPLIEKICDNKKCKYIHENNILPYTIFKSEKIFADEVDENKVNRVIEQIIIYMENEITKYNYLPNNFMFIFPILSKNFLANRLESRLQDFWIKKFEDKQYQKNVLMKNNYWNNKINTDSYNKYVFLHKSDEGKSINLKESENATRILSIHASKGNGCEVVFLLGTSEKSLRLFSHDTGNLMYDSLLHVALTRQKKSLYVGLEDRNDDIYLRFNNTCDIILDTEILPLIEYVNKNIQYPKIINYSLEYNFNKIDKLFIKPNNYEELIPETENKNIIDWGHHIIRYAVFRYNIMAKICNNEKLINDDNDYIDQFITILKKISELQIKILLYNDYYDLLKKITNLNKTQNYNQKIAMPILQFKTTQNTKYHKYTHILHDIIKLVQNKIIKALNKNKMPILCPLETVILFHIIEIMDNGRYAEITIMDIYSILYCYDECSNTLDDTHNYYKCLCKKNFNEGNNSNDESSFNDIRQSIKHHYEKTEIIENIYSNYSKYIKEHYNEIFEYNINQREYYGKESQNFCIGDTFPIIANSKNYVIQFIIKPQFNKLNFNDIIFSGLFNTFITLNIDKEKYKNKKIIICILSLDSITPIFYEFNIDKNNKNLKESIKQYLLKFYKNNHKDIYDFYIYNIEQKPKEKHNITYIIEKLEEKKYEKVQKYIKKFFDDIRTEYNKEKNQERKKMILMKVNDKELFLDELNKSLENAIDEYLELIENNDDNI